GEQDDAGLRIRVPVSSSPLVVDDPVDADERRVDDLSHCGAPCHSTRTHGVLESKVADAAGSATDAVADVCGLRGVDHPDDLQLDARRQHLDQSAATTERC